MKTLEEELEEFYNLYTEGRDKYKLPIGYIDYFKAREFMVKLISFREKKIVEEILALVQEDIDFGAKHQQIVSTKAQSALLVKLKTI
jgi:hypothetical protein